MTRQHRHLALLRYSVRLWMSVGSILACAGFLALPVSAAQFVEARAAIDVTSWRYHEGTGLSLKNSQSYSVRCVMGTNLWLIESQSGTNTTETTWFVKGKLIRQIAYNPDGASEETGFRTFRRLRPSVSITPVPGGYPGSELLVNVPWFAFCSGPFLRQSTRGVPVPTSPPDRPSFGFTNETTVFPDSFGLPRRAAFYVNKQIKCLYEVQESTNVLGWNFPLAFVVTHYEPDQFGNWRRQLYISARVTGVEPAPGFAVPADLLELLELREQSPGLRRRQGSFRSIE